MYLKLCWLVNVLVMSCSNISLPDPICRPSTRAIVAQIDSSTTDIPLADHFSPLHHCAPSVAAPHLNHQGTAKTLSRKPTGVFSTPTNPLHRSSNAQMWCNCRLPHSRDLHEACQIHTRLPDPTTSLMTFSRRDSCIEFALREIH